MKPEPPCSARGCSLQRSHLHHRNDRSPRIQTSQPFGYLAWYVRIRDISDSYAGAARPVNVEELLAPNTR